MAEKHKYTVNRSMQDGAHSFERGDTREMTEIEAATLIESGALSLPGKDPEVREPAVVHTFGKEPSGYTEYTDAGDKPSASITDKRTSVAVGTADKAPPKPAKRT